MQKYIYLILIFLYLGCSHNQEKNSRFTEEQIASLVKHVKLIPLETTNESLLDKTHKILVTDSHIYIHDDFKDGGIVIFNNKGEFVKRISNGKGPGELLRLYDIAFDEKNDELVVYRDKNAGELKGGTEAIYNPDELPPIAFPRGTSDNHFISWYYPGEDDLFATNSTIISEADKQKVKGLTRNDNPVLVFYKLKEF